MRPLLHKAIPGPSKTNPQTQGLLVCRHGCKHVPFSRLRQDIPCRYAHSMCGPCRLLRSTVWAFTAPVPQLLAQKTWLLLLLFLDPLLCLVGMAPFEELPHLLEFIDFLLGPVLLGIDLSRHYVLVLILVDPARRLRCRGGCFIVGAVLTKSPRSAFARPRRRPRGWHGTLA